MIFQRKNYEQKVFRLFKKINEDPSLNEYMSWWVSLSIEAVLATNELTPVRPNYIFFYVCAISKKTLIRTGAVVVLAKFNHIAEARLLHDPAYGLLYPGPRNDRLGFIFNTSITSRKCNLTESNIFQWLAGEPAPMSVYLFISFVRRYQHYRASLKYEWKWRYKCM